jgi:hypothetical protein
MVTSEASTRPCGAFFQIFVLNYREILGSCRFHQFAFGIDVLEVQPDVIGGGLEQFGHQALRQPQRLGVDENADMNLLVITGVKQKG